MATDTEPREELELPHLKERLWSELAELHAERRRSPAPAGGAAAELVRRRARRSLRVAAVGAAAATALVVGVLAVHVVAGGTDRPAGPDADAVLMERIATATDEALAESVVHSVDDQVAPDGRRLTLEIWRDETTGVSRILSRDAAGNPVVDVGPLTGPTLESPAYSGQRVVDHCVRGYIEHVDTGGASTGGPPGAIDVRELLADGEVVEDGTESVGGRELIRLRGTHPDGGDYVLLVDPETYRVVAGRGTFHDGGTYSTTYEYVPRTAEALDLLHPPIPDGFTPADPSEHVGGSVSCDGP